MTDLEPNKTAPEWKPVAWSVRVRDAVLLLSINGFISESEKAKVYKRITKWQEALEEEKRRHKHDMRNRLATN